VAVKPKRLPYFKVGKELKDLINAKLRRTQEMPAVVTADPPSAPATEARSANSR
jgi:hypothetical protein